MESKIIYVLNENELDKCVSKEEVTKFVDNGRNKLDINELKKNCFDVFGNVDGSLLTNKLFDSSSKFDVFISYSSADLEYANKLAVYLKKEMNLDCFVDSIYWETMHKMMDIINHQYNGHSFNQDISRNIARNFDHTRMAVATALINVISKCKYFVFIESCNSIIEKENRKTIKKQTESPWINFEVNYANILCPLLEHSMKEELGVIYDLDLANFENTDSLISLKILLNHYECAYSV